RDAVFGEFLFDARRQADGDGHGGMYDKVLRIVLQPTARRKCAGFHPPGAASLAAGAFARSSPRLEKRRYSSRQAQASVAAYVICAAESCGAAQFEVLVPLGMRNPRSMPARLRTPVWPKPERRATSPRSSMFFSTKANTPFSARRSSFKQMPALTVRASERSPASSGWTSLRRSWKRYTARAVATWTSAGRWLSPFLNAGRVSVSHPA